MADQWGLQDLGNRELRYDGVKGMFQLITISYVKMHCDMNHKLYPFDTQRCDFKMRTDEDIHNQENLPCIA